VKNTNKNNIRASTDTMISIPPEAAHIQQLPMILTDF
jgi:hypothetical protein